MPTVKILTVIGTRPQFVKAAMVSRAIINHNADERYPRLVEEIIQTGQHYDREMSAIFFEEMGIPEPVADLQVKSALHGEMTGLMLTRVEAEIMDRRPDWVLVYGDSNSTVGGALASAKLHVPVAHVEAGLRSYNRRMPEEINRVVADHISDLLFCPTHLAVRTLAGEGVTKGVHHVGDVMYDAALVFGELAEKRSDVLDRLAVKQGGYCLATCHRAENTDDPGRLRGILTALGAVREKTPVIFPLHPRTRKYIDLHGLGGLLDGLTVIPPASFLDMVRLEKSAALILTDSGGVQKEAYFHGVPCVTLRDETEWVETVEQGWNILAGADTEAILDAVSRAGTGQPIPEFGQGRAAETMVDLLVEATPDQED